MEAYKEDNEEDMIITWYTSVTNNFFTRLR